MSTRKKQGLIALSQLKQYRPVNMREIKVNNAASSSEEDQSFVAANIKPAPTESVATATKALGGGGLARTTIIAIIVSAILFGGALIGIAVYFSLYYNASSSSTSQVLLVHQSSSSSSSTGTASSSLSSIRNSSSSSSSSTARHSSSSSTGIPRSSSLSSSTGLPISSSGSSTAAKSSSSSAGSILSSSSSFDLSSSSSSGIAGFCDFGPYCNGTYPTTQLGSKLLPNDYVVSSVSYSGKVFFGIAVAINPNATTLVIGGFADNDNGATWVFTRNGSTWNQQGNKLIGTLPPNSPLSQGATVAISYDGNTLATGEGTSGGNTSAWIFTRSSGIWTQQGDPFTQPDTAVGDGVAFGSCVSLSADGNTLAVGGAYDNGNIGAAWIYTRSGGVWTAQSSKLVGTGYNTGTSSSVYQGTSCALSADGNTLVVGGLYDSDLVGAIWVFVRNGVTWTQQGSKLVGTGAQGTAQQGQSVTISGDGNTIVSGGPTDNNAIGTAWVFVRGGTTWTQQGSKLAVTDATGQPSLGWSVSLAPSGNLVAIGGPGDDSIRGAVWMFGRSGNTWSQLGNKLLGTDAIYGVTGEVDLGFAVSLSNQTMLAVGGIGDNDGIGATWIFY